MKEREAVQKRPQVTCNTGRLSVHGGRQTDEGEGGGTEGTTGYLKTCLYP
jgi:hypothetical protein